VEALDRVRAVDDGTDLGAVGQERYELGPGVPPQPDDRWVSLPPRLLELVQPLGGGLFAGGAVDRPQVFGDLSPVGLARVAEAVADQVQLMPTSA